MLQFFGPPDKESVHSEILMRWKVKIKTNDAMSNSSRLCKRNNANYSKRSLFGKPTLPNSTRTMPSW